MTYTTYCPWFGDPGLYADQVIEAERKEVSALLGPDGRPLRYEPRQPVGFDLRPASKRDRPDG